MPDPVILSGAAAAGPTDRCDVGRGAAGVAPAQGCEAPSVSSRNANHRRVRDAERIFQRGMMVWAQEILRMRKAGLHTLTWACAAGERAREEDCVFD